MSKGEMATMRWFNKRVRRTHVKLLELLVEEDEMELMGLPGEARRFIHTEALFHTLRDVHQPDALAEEVDEELLNQYAEFLAEKHHALIAMCQEIREWAPADGKPPHGKSMRKAAMN